MARLRNPGSVELCFSPGSHDRRHARNEVINIRERHDVRDFLQSTVQIIVACTSSVI